MEKREIQIKIGDQDLKGVYANLMIVRHTKEEFCLDFINTFEPPVLVARVLTSPSHLKRMILALEENMKKYEENFGEIKLNKEEESPKIGFSPK